MGWKKTQFVFRILVKHIYSKIMLCQRAVFAIFWIHDAALIDLQRCHLQRCLWFIITDTERGCVCSQWSLDFSGCALFKKNYNYRDILNSYKRTWPIHFLSPMSLIATFRLSCVMSLLLLKTVTLKGDITLRMMAGCSASSNDPQVDGRTSGWMPRRHASGVEIYCAKCV